MTDEVKRVLILASSAKNKNLCVAGLDFKSKKLIRLVSNIEDTDGAIPKSYMNGIDVGDVVDIGVLHSYPNKYQPENYLVNFCKKPLIQSRFNNNQITEIMEGYSYSDLFIFGNTDSVLSSHEMENNSTSLAWVHVNEVSVYLIESYGKKKTRTNFFYNGFKYNNIRVTDQKFFNSEEKMPEAYFLMSLPHKPWITDSGKELYYKFVAKIFPAG